MRRVIQMLTTVLVVAPLQLTAQDLTVPLRLDGQRVRVRIHSENLGRTMDIDGTVAVDHPDTITVIESSGRLWAVPRSNVQQIDINRGKDHLGGALRGATIGAVFGLLFGMTEIDCNDQGYGIDCDSDGSRPSRVEYASRSVGLFAEAGAMIGGVLGVQLWEPVAIRQQSSADSKSRGIGLRFRF